MLTFAFLAFVVLGVLVRLWLAGRQMRHVHAHREAVPEAFASRITLDAHQRAARYTIDRQRLGMIETLVDAVLRVALTLLGGLMLLQWAVAQLGLPDLWHQVVLVLAFFAVGGVVGLPLDLYRQFVLEARHGFNRMTLGLWLRDQALGLLVSLVLGVPLLAGLLWLMRDGGTLWWLWAWAVWMSFMLLMMVVVPRWIAPLFNRFEPLPDGELAERLRALTARCGLVLEGLFVVDGSRRSAHGNAYFTGIGRARRIVLFDTLLQRLSPVQVEAVLAHELGHAHHGHVRRRLIMMAVVSMVGFALLAWLVQQPAFYLELGVMPDLQRGPEGMALVLIMLAAPVFLFPLTPLATWLSRADEYEADRYAAAQTGPEPLRDALLQLYEDNAATLTPDRLHTAFHASHPPAADRLAALMQLPTPSASHS